MRQCIRGALSVWCWKEGILSHATLVCGNKGAAQGRARSFFLSCFFHSNPISTNSKLNKVAMIAGEHAPRPPEPCGTCLVFHLLSLLLKRTTTASLCSHPPSGLHEHPARIDGCQWVPFFYTDELGDTLLLHTHLCVRHHPVREPFCCPLSHGNSV